MHIIIIVVSREHLQIRRPFILNPFPNLSFLSGADLTLALGHRFSAVGFWRSIVSGPTGQLRRAWLVSADHSDLKPTRKNPPEQCSINESHLLARK